MKSKFHNFVCEGLVTSNSHSTAYALITYVTSWLKYHYPAQYMTSVMTFNTDDDEMTARYVNECSRLGLKVVGPRINISKDKYVIRDNKIISPLNVVANIGGKGLDTILEERKINKFESFEDFFERIDKRVINVRVLINLILSGAFNMEDSIESSFDKFMFQRDDNVFRQLLCVDCDYRYPCNVKSGDEENTYCPSCGSQNLKFEIEDMKGKLFNKNYVNNMVFGFSYSGNPLKKYVTMIAKYNTDGLSELDNITEGEVLNTAIFVKLIKKHVDKRGNEMAFITVSDGEIDCSLTIFASDWESLKNEIVQGCCYIVKAVKNRGNNLLFSSRDKRNSILRLGI